MTMPAIGSITLSLSDCTRPKTPGFQPCGMADTWLAIPAVFSLTSANMADTFESTMPASISRAHSSIASRTLSNISAAP